MTVTQNLDVFLWNRKVGTLVTYKEKYTEKVYSYFDGGFIKYRSAAPHKWCARSVWIACLYGG